MGRTASLIFNNQSFTVDFIKLDRKKIYGWTKTEVFDDQNRPCSLATIADEQYVLPSGSIAMASFNDEGEYISKSNLIGVDKEGKKVVIGAADTFRAAAIEQLSSWADRVNVPIVKQK